MTKALRIHIGETLDDIGARAIAAWHRMERGEAVAETHISFETWDAMVKLLPGAALTAPPQPLKPRRRYAPRAGARKGFGGGKFGAP
jgi:hypothetical protein